MDISYNPNFPTPDSESDTFHHSQNLEQRLKASQARVSCLLETLPQIVWLAQANGSVYHFNSRWYDYTGLAAEESLNWAFLQAIHPDDRDRLRQSWAVSIATNDLAASDPFAHPTTVTELCSIGVAQGSRGTQEVGEEKVSALNVISYQCRIQGTEGSYRWFNGQITPVRGEQGEILEWIGTYTPSLSITQDVAVPWQTSRGVPWVRPAPSKHCDQPLECLGNEIYELGERTSSFSPFPFSLSQTDEADSVSTVGVRTDTQLQSNLVVETDAGKLNDPDAPNMNLLHLSATGYKQHLRQLISKLSQAIIWEAEATTNQFTFVSQSAERVLGYPVQQWLNEPDFWMSLIHPEDREWTVALCQKQRVQGRDYELVYRCRRADNQVIWLRDRAFVVRDQQGRIHKRRGLMVDITPVKQAEIEAVSGQGKEESPLDNLQGNGKQEKQESLGKAGRSVTQSDRKLSPKASINLAFSPFTFLCAGAKRPSEQVISPQLHTASAMGEQRPTDGTSSELIELQFRMHFSSAIAKLTQQVISATPIVMLMDNLVSLVSQTLQVEYVQVLELLPDGNALKLIAGVGWHQNLVGNALIDANVNTQAGYTLQARQPVVIADFSRESRFQNSPLLHDHNIISGISVIIPEASSVRVGKHRDTQTRGQEERLTNLSQPLVSSSSPASQTTQPFGILAAYTSRQREFTPSDIDFLQSAANILTAAIQYQQTHTELYQVQAQLAQTTVVLEKCTREFDEFAYIASHDLKAPLRAIANLSQWIEEDISYQLNEENSHQLQLLRRRVHRLEVLLEGLLQYSRAGRFKSDPECVDVTALLRHILDTLNPPSEFTCEILPGMPVLVTERLPLEQVFTHLIDNAIQHHPATTGTVKISVQERPEVYEFAVTDNGAGIAPQFQQRVFGIFQTLGSHNHKEKAGVGLAIAKKIVEGRGGTIRLESQAGWGATFYFTWPKLLGRV